jgi:phage tail sheath protein FI
MVFRRAVSMAIRTPYYSSEPTSGPRRGAYPIPLSTVTTTGFLGRTERGPINEPVCIESFPEYCRYFGGHIADGSVSHAVHDFFVHGGRRAVVVRVANRASRARIDVPTATDPLCFEAMYPGRHERLRISIDYEQVEDDPSMFNLVVQRMSIATNPVIEDQELYPLISTQPSHERFIGKVLKGSHLIALAGPVPEVRPAAMPPEWPGDPVRYLGLTEPGQDGEDLTDYDIIGSDRDGTGLFAFGRGPRIDLLALPLPPEKDLGTTAFLAASRFCEHQRALMIWDPPWSWRSVDAALLGARRLEFANGNVVTYFPRIRPRGARARFAGGLPACGAIAGMLAQRDRRGVFGRDEDTDYTLRAALTPVLDLSALEAQRLARHGINAFVQATGGVTRLVGRVTLGASGFGPAFGASLERRRLSLFILDAVEQAVTEAVAASDPDTALPRVESQLRRFFGELHVRGALKGQRSGQAFYLQTRNASGPGPLGLRFGLALGEPSRFAEYAIDLEGARPGNIHRVQGLEAEQLFS